MNNLTFIKNTKSIYTGFMLFVLCSVFLLSHSNQNSSQSLATILLLLSPLLIILKKGSTPDITLGLRYFIATSIAIFTYSLMIYFQNPISDVSSGMMRALSFYLLAPAAVYILWHRPINRTWLFWLALAATFIALYPVIKESDGSNHRGFSSAHPIFWGNVCLTSAVLTLILSRDEQLNVKGKYILGIIGLGMGLTASLWSQTRGGWISIPLVLIGLTFFRLIKLREAVVAFMLLIALFSSSEMLRNRVLKTFHFGQDSVVLDSSTQLRIDMWEVSYEAFKENPIIGTGLDGFSNKLQELNSEHKASFYFEHPHNELMEVLSSRGIVGLILLAAFLTSIIHCYYNHKTSIYAKAGLISCMQYIIFSSSEIFFSTKFTLVYFIILQAILMTACERSALERNAK
ncbi:O-antigen ligase family protein [Thalassolituus marinus]|uniref:O-antigen ligase family protein n=1 Tax=Thalassolituus marinus TaxID=671053 RepID=A0ABS7ZPJ2_9GAMM|nr:O-antigen ligase family protein [Thalassolituus marinus]MCA6063123.1 O-antigen ligase family protein [Thalassolituus marinus]